MPSLNVSFSAQGGPIINLYVEPSFPRQTALLKANSPVPSAVLARFLIDTGASSTCIDPSILQSLGLIPTGTTDIHTPSTSGVALTFNQFDVQLVIPHTSLNRYFRAIPVIEADLSSQGIDGLLGRDVLSQCVLHYNGEINYFTLSF